MMLPGRCAQCGELVELVFMEPNPVTVRADHAVVPCRWEDRGTGEQHRCAS